MHAHDLDYHAPAQLIAQEAIEPRDAARLLVLGRQPGQRSHHQVRDLDQLLNPNDLLVVNRTQVIPARLLGQKSSGGAVEVLLLHQEAQQQAGESWRCMIRGRVRPGSLIDLAPNCRAEVTACDPDGQRILQFPPGLSVLDLCEKEGHVPLPPYITRADRADDHQRYQSIFAQVPGSVAAPTASLHFTPQLLDRIRAKGVKETSIELRIGPGTFKPVQHAILEEHPIHSEWCSCSQESLDAIQACRKGGGRVIAVGTTVVRCLESCWLQSDSPGQPQPFCGWTSCFLYPPQLLSCCDYLLTNFHLPRSTLLALVACLVGVDDLMQHYQAAIAAGYRLFSYGDAMLVPNRRAIQLASEQ